MNVVHNRSLRVLIITLLTLALSLAFPIQSTKAKDDDKLDWIDETFNPTINTVVEEFNQSMQINWYINLSNHLILGDKDLTVENLENLRSEIEQYKKRIESIEIPNEINRKIKKNIKKINRNINKALSRTDKRAKKLIKRIKKDKKVTSIQALKSEYKRISKVNDIYTKLNDKHETNLVVLEFIEPVKINEDEAKKIIKRHEKELFRLNEEKKNKEIEDAKNKLIDDYLDSINESTVVGKSEVIIYDAFKASYDLPDDTVTVVEYDENSKTLTATVRGKDGWSDKSIGRGFYEDSSSVYRELYEDKRIDEVWLTITFPMLDQYGNLSDDEVMRTWMSRETMDKVNWKNFNYLNLLDVVDGKMIFPQFVQ